MRLLSLRGRLAHVRKTTNGVLSGTDCDGGLPSHAAAAGGAADLHIRSPAHAWVGVAEWPRRSRGDPGGEAQLRSTVLRPARVSTRCGSTSQDTAVLRAHPLTVTG